MPGSLSYGIPDYPGGELNDRRRLMEMLRSRSRRDRKTAEHQLDQLNRNDQLEESRQQRLDTFNARQQQREDFYNDTAAQRRETREATSADNAVRNKALQQNADTQRLQTLQYMLSDPAFKNEHEGIKAEIARMSGVGGTMPTTTTKPGKGEYGPGGQPPTGAPAPAPTGAGYTPPTGAFELASPPVGPPGTAQTDRINQLKAGGQGYVEGGRVIGGPPGYDFNTNTAEWIPQGQQGTINGEPAGVAIAHGAQRTGIAPESPSGVQELARINSQEGIGMPFRGGLQQADFQTPTAAFTGQPAPQTGQPAGTQVAGGPAPAPASAPPPTIGTEMGRGEFRGNYPMAPATPPFNPTGTQLIQSVLPSSPPDYVNPKALPATAAQPAPPPAVNPQANIGEYYRRLLGLA